MLELRSYTAHANSKEVQKCSMPKVWKDDHIQAEHMLLTSNLINSVYDYAAEHMQQL